MLREIVLSKYRNIVDIEDEGIESSNLPNPESPNTTLHTANHSLGPQINGGHLEYLKELIWDHFCPLFTLTA